MDICQDAADKAVAQLLGISKTYAILLRNRHNKSALSWR
jgi:hypothetical protein